MSRLGQTWDNRLPCGTEAAYQRHQRHHQSPCYECRQAHARYAADQRGGEYTGPVVPDPRPVRNGLPGPGRYVYGAPRPGRALRALGAAWDEHGMPDDLFEEAS